MWGKSTLLVLFVLLSAATSSYAWMLPGPGFLPPPPPPPPGPLPIPFVHLPPIPLWYGGELPERLSKTGLSHPQVKTFSPQYPLWSDGAEKSRWVYLPPGKQIVTSDLNRWVFPRGTKFWKEFRHQGQPVETRYFEKITDGEGIEHWRFGTYQWDAEGRTATLVSPLGVRDAARTQFAGVNHHIPSHGECFLCHNRGGDPVLGFDSIQLSTFRDPLAPHRERIRSTDLNLKTLQEDQRLTHPIPIDLEITASSGSARAAMGYFHANCGHCHNEAGVAKTSLFYNRLEFPTRRESQNPIFQTGVDVPTLKFHAPGQLPFVSSYRIASGDPSCSAVLWLMGHRMKPFVKMPPIGSEATDREALRLVLQWVRQLGD